MGQSYAPGLLGGGMGQRYCIHISERLCNVFAVFWGINVQIQLSNYYFLRFLLCNL